MARFPLFLELSGRRCLVAGGGEVGRRKAATALEAGAGVVIVDPEPSAALLDFVSSHPSVRLERRRFEPDDVTGAALVFACTGDRSVDDAVAAAAAAAGAPAVRAGSAGGARDWTTGAVLRRGDVVVAVSTEGAGPGLAARLRDAVTAVVGDEAAEAARMLGRLRDTLRATVPDARRRRRAMRAALDGGLLERLREGRTRDAENVVRGALDAATGEEKARCTR